VVAFRLSPEVLGQTRFAFSPLAEAGSALHLLAVPHVGSVHQGWIDRARRATADLDMDLLTSLVNSCTWLPSFLYQPATSPDTGFDTQLSLLEQAGIDRVSADLQEVWSGREMPPRLAGLIARGQSGLGEITDGLWSFWRAAIEPHWPRICAVLEDDVAHRAGRVVTGGLYELLADLHPETSVDGDLLRVHKPHHADLTYGGTHLVLIPSVFTYPALVIDHDDQGALSLVYGARGVARTWEQMQQPSTAPEDHLSGLLGRTRAAILARLAVPMTTTELAVDLDQSLGAVSEHLTRLRVAGLLTSWRKGRRVYYRQTPLATTLVQAGVIDADRGVG
jgi:DNA-binding transcriptional ArsR family regulator